MFGIRGSWGITGSSSVAVDNYFNQYTSRAGRYGTSYFTSMSGMKLDDLRPQKKTGLNLGFNLGLFEDMFEFAAMDMEQMTAGEYEYTEEEYYKFCNENLGLELRIKTP